MIVLRQCLTYRNLLSSVRVARVSMSVARSVDFGNTLSPGLGFSRFAAQVVGADFLVNVIHCPIFLKTLNSVTLMQCCLLPNQSSDIVRSSFHFWPTLSR